MLWDMHLCVFDVRLSFENRVPKVLGILFAFKTNIKTCQALRETRVNA